MTPIIMSGGRGTRLWPFSRIKFPKPFCSFFDESLMAKTLHRLSAFGKIGVITTIEQRSLTQMSFSSLELTPQFEIYEPIGRNTALSVALICHHQLLKGEEEAVVGVFPADHLIQNQKSFERAIELSQARALQNKIVTLGIRPNFPATGYGYIEVDNANSDGALVALGFHEKPNSITAEQYLKSGNYFWNSGIFIFKPSVMIELYKSLKPRLWKQVESLSDWTVSSFSNIEAISLDFAIMNHIKKDLECVPAEVGWSDVGSWREIAEVCPTEKVFETAAKGNKVYSMSKKTYSVVGADNLIVVDTPDALLITNSESAQLVGQSVTEIEKVSPGVTSGHSFEHRPWGEFHVLEDRKEFKLKRIVVLPGKQLSYQSHEKRAEHWIVVRGKAQVTLNESVHEMKAGSYIFIPVGAKHRIKNIGNEDVEFIEVQTGSHFGEEDIIRYSDDFGRADRI